MSSISTNYHKFVIVVLCLLVIFSFTACEEEGCIAEGSFVLTPSGYVAIESLTVGSEIYSIDVRSGELLTTTVRRSAHSKQTCWAIAKNNSDTIWLTPTHPCYDPNSGTYKQLSEFASSKSSSFLSFSNSQLLENSFAIYPHASKLLTVYDISVGPPFYNFIVEGFVVHNKTPLLQFDTVVVEGNCQSLAVNYRLIGMQIRCDSALEFCSNLGYADSINSICSNSVLDFVTCTGVGNADTITVVIGLSNNVEYWTTNVDDLLDSLSTAHNFDCIVSFQSVGPINEVKYQGRVLDITGVRLK